MVLSSVALSFAVLPAGAIWPLVLGAMASLVTCCVAVAVVVVQRHAGRRRGDPSPPP
jgi:uncharacterized integral membrane protein